MHQKQTKAETKVQIEKLDFESASKGMAGPGLAEPSHESSESEAPLDTWDPEARCPRDLELEAPLAPAHLEPDCKAKSQEAQSKSYSKCKRKHTTAFILRNNAQHKQNYAHTNANNRHAIRTSRVHVNQAIGSTSMLYQVFKQILMFRNATRSSTTSPGLTKKSEHSSW